MNKNLTTRIQSSRVSKAGNTHLPVKPYNANNSRIFLPGLSARINTSPTKKA